MQIIILGGTRFFGRALVNSAVDRGHILTLFNRGKTNPELYPDIEKLTGDRDGNLDALLNRKWDAVIDTNLRGTYTCTKFALRSMMRQRWGRIISMASIAGIIGNVGQTNYAASKAGIIAFTKSIAREVGSLNITANAIAPGFIVTEMTDKMPQERREAVLQFIALRRYGKPEDVAELAAFLASDRASYITGQVIGIDGGMFA